MALITMAGLSALAKVGLPLLAGYGLSKIKNSDRSYNEKQTDLAYERNLAMMREQSAFNAAEAQKNRDYQTEMSNTSYQRAVADMKLAGINPILAINNGGASVPNGAQGSSGSGSVPQTAQSSYNSLGALLPILAGLITKIPNAKKY